MKMGDLKSVAIHKSSFIIGPDPDDLLAEAFTDAKGEFTLKVKFLLNC